MKKVLITGGTGGVGTFLTPKLIAKGYEVVMFSRKAGIKNGIRLYEWNPAKGTIDIAAFDQVNHIIHLAGAGIADHRWTESYKKEIYKSRIQSTKLLVDTIVQNKIVLNSFVSASAIGIYGDDVEGIADESYPVADTFLGKLCHDWETEASKISAAGIRVVMIRTGVVLSKESGFIPKVVTPVKLFAGSALGSGKQLMSWIHIEDLCDIYVKAIEDTHMEGPYNAVAPIAVSNIEVTRKMAAKLHRPILLPPVPAFVLRIVLGEVAAMLMGNLAVSSHKIKERGFTFAYRTIDEALNDLL
ncbi:MAG: TIGR01777 family oxidoreductase [Bacteroidota bacterium]